MLIYSGKLRFFDDFCLALTKNLRRAKVSDKNKIIVKKATWIELIHEPG